MSRIELYSLVHHEAKVLGLSCYVVGGVIRDLLRTGEFLDRDVDFLIEGPTEVLARTLQKRIGGTVQCFPQFLTAKVKGFVGYAEYDEIDLAGSRSEIYSVSGSLPTVAPAPLYEDLKRRDFSVNAMAIRLEDLISFLSGILDILELKNRVIDLFEGKEDLEARQLRVLHEQSFRDDPTRIIRLIRYEARLQFMVESKTQAILSRAVHERVLNAVSVERMWSEIRKALCEDNIEGVIQGLLREGVLSQNEEFFEYFFRFSEDTWQAFVKGANQLPGEERALTLMVLIDRHAQMFPGSLLPQQLGKLGIGKSLRKEISRLFSGFEEMSSWELSNQIPKRVFELSRALLSSEW
ncbi:MAG: CCA tRNA nucleotidyltransferase [Bdellovibrionales bacterium]|nr:CCA tRNA nucleotidyltransferase [Bdellovibrionales bacterium]